MRGPGFVGGVAERLKGTLRAPRTSRNADLPPMMDQLMRKGDPAVLWDDLHQVLFDLFRRGVPGQFEPARESQHVRVNHDTHGDSVPRSEYNVGGLASDSGKAEDFFHGLRNLPFVVVDDDAGSALDGLCLIAKEASGADEFFEFRKGGGGHCLRCRESFEERRRNEVDANVRALRREDRRNGKLPRILVIKRADYAGVGLAESVEDCSDTLRSERLLRLAGLILWRYGL